MNIMEYCVEVGRQDVTVAEYAQARGWPGYITSGIEYEVVGGVVDGNAARALAAAIIQNVGSSDFQWTGDKAGRLLEGSMTGDCYVLVEGVVQAITELALGDAYMASKHEPFMVMDTQSAMIGNGQPNIDGLGNSWKFDDHHWLVYEGAEYDILFCGDPLDKSTWLNMTTDRGQSGLISQTYSDGTVLYWTSAEPAWSNDPTKAFSTADVNFNAEAGRVQTMSFLDTVGNTFGEWQGWVSETMTSIGSSLDQTKQEVLNKLNEVLEQAKAAFEKED